MDNEKTIAEINEVIAKVEAGLEPNCEVGARDKMTIKGLLRASNIDKNIKFFPCKRENSAKIVHHFVKVKGIPQSRFSINAQPGIFILCEAGAEGKVQKEPKNQQSGKAPKEEKVPREVKVQQPEKEKKVGTPKEQKTLKEVKVRNEKKVMKAKKVAKPQKKGTGQKTKAKGKKGTKGRA
ncbi:MAG: hypothetical protein WEB30_18775 [Cyclobacteriaceae bacterium]